MVMKMPTAEAGRSASSNKASGPVFQERCSKSQCLGTIPKARILDPVLLPGESNQVFRFGAVDTLSRLTSGLVRSEREQCVVIR